MSRRRSLPDVAAVARVDYDLAQTPSQELGLAMRYHHCVDANDGPTENNRNDNVMLEIRSKDENLS